MQISVAVAEMVPTVASVTEQLTVEPEAPQAPAPPMVYLLVSIAVCRMGLMAVAVQGLPVMAEPLVEVTTRAP
jgi:hypothetical protein